MSLGDELKPHLPFLRRYARALTGSQGNWHRDCVANVIADPEEEEIVE